MSSYSTRTTKTVMYSSSGGPGKTVTETRTYGDGGGTRTETNSYNNDGPSLNFNTRFGGVNINSGGMSIDTRGGSPARQTVVNPLNARYSKGWGSKKDSKSSTRHQTPMKLKGKTYSEIKQQCLQEGRLFEDPDFPAVDASIFYSRSPPRPFVWKRPSEICTSPQFFSGGASRFDVKQGELGDCWLLAAIAGLCQHKNLFYRVVPEQSFEKEYAGIFHFQFWQYGEWTDIIVDDRLPTFYDKLVFMHSVDKDEFWSPLLEKAYAKLCGSYESLKGGATCEAMEDFTGGVTEIFDLKQAPANLFHIMLKAFERNSLMGCSIDANPNQLEAELSNGLIMGHAYTITDVTMIDIKTSRMKGKIPMVRVRNPWGNECEWKGAWSDKSQEWRFISDDERKEIGLTFSDDGEFWMSYADFIKNFQKLEICNLGPDSLHDEQMTNKKRWEGTSQDGGWKRRVNAGGCRNFLETFWTNPQYRIAVVDPDDDDDDNTGTLLVALMQKGRRKLRQEGVDLLTMGYAIYKIKDDHDGPLDLRFFKYNASIAKSPSFINMREICGRHKLEPGNYCVIPSTFEPNQDGDFMLRIYSEKPAASVEMDEETGMSDVKPASPTSPGPPSSGFSSDHDNRSNGHHGGMPRQAWQDSDSGMSHDPRDNLFTFLNKPIKPVVEEREEGGERKRFLSFKFFDDLPFSNGLRGGRLHLPKLRKNFFSGIFKAREEVVEEGMMPVNESVVTAVNFNYLTGERAFVPGMTPDFEEPDYWVIPSAEVTAGDSQQEKEMKEAFRRVSGEDMEIDAYELQEILNAAFMKGESNEFRFDGFSNDTCRSMVAMMDEDRSGKLGYEEFKKLWTDIRLWKTVFKQHDKDKSGNFNSYELRMAFHSVGFRVSNGTFNALVQRYSHRDSKIYFDDFIHCVVRMKTMFEIFKEMDHGGKAIFDLDQFIQTTMYS